MDDLRGPTGDLNTVLRLGEVLDTKGWAAHAQLVDFGLANWLGLCAAGHGDLRAEMAKLTYPVPWLTPHHREGP